MTNNTHQTLERIARRVPVPEPAYDRLLRRRDRKARNQRLSAAVLAIVLTLLSITGLMRAFRHSERPANEPTPTPVDRGIFSGMGGWIAYSNLQGADPPIWALDPERPEIRKQLVTHLGKPLAWSSDGSKLLILRLTGQGSTGDASLYVLNADGSETLLVDSGCWYCLSGGSFSPDGSKVVYASKTADGASHGIYLVDPAGGTPRLLPQPLRGPYDAVFSPDGSQIAYFAGGGDHDNSLWVMNADGSGSRVLLKDRGFMKSSAELGSLGWFPDGRRLMFSMGNSLGYPQGSIYVVGADGSGLTRVIANGTNPKVSPDGSRIAYDRLNYSCCSGLAFADPDGAHVQRLDDAASGPWNPIAREGSGTRGTSGTAGATRAGTVIYAIAALAAAGIVVLWARRKRKARKHLDEGIG